MLVQAFFYGRHQIPLAQLEAESPYAQALTAQQLEEAYALGRMAGERQGETSQGHIDATYNQARNVLKQTGREKTGEYSAELADGIDLQSLDEGQRAAYELAQQIAPAVKCNIICYQGAKGWGFYDHNTDTIHINVNAKWNKKSMMAFTLGHELVHRAKAGSPAQFRSFAKFLMEQYHKQGSDINKMIREQMYWAEQSGNKLTRDQAFEEVVADACQRMLLDTDAGKKLAQWGAQSQQNKSFLQKVKTIIEDLLKKLRSYFKNVDNDSLAAREFARIDKNAKQILADMFVDMSIDAGEKLSTIKAAGMLDQLNKNTAQQGGVKNKNTALYSYESIISKPDMYITSIDDAIPMNRADIVVKAKQNAARIGKFDPKTQSVSVHVDDIGVDVVIGTAGLKHGLDRRNAINGLVTLKAGEILKNSIRINELVPKKAEADASYVLIGVARDSNGELLIVRSLVNRFSHELTTMDVLYAINAKKGNRLRSVRPGFQGPDTDSTISIADVLDYVNEYFPDILPEDVLKYYGYDSRPDGDLGADALYKTQIGEDLSPREMLLNTVEGMVANDTEYKKLQEYRRKIQELNATEEHLQRLNEQLKQLYFAEGGRDYEMINKLETQRAEALTKLNRYDSQLINLENTKPIRDIMERMKQAAYQKGFQKAKDYYRQKSDAREESLKQHYQESRRNAVERHDKAQIRQQIRKDVERLASLLNKGNKQKNVKQELQAFAGAALRTAQGTFLNNYNEYDMVRNGLNTTMNREQKQIFQRCQELLEELDKVRDEMNAEPGADNMHDKWDPEAALRREDREEALKKELAKNMGILRDAGLFRTENELMEDSNAEQLMNELLTAYSALKDSELAHVRGVYSQVIYDQIDSVKKFLAGKAVKDMTTVELKELQKMYRMVMHTVTTSNELFAQKRKADVRKLGEEVIEQLTKKKTHTDYGVGLFIAYIRMQKDRRSY